MKNKAALALAIVLSVGLALLCRLQSVRGQQGEPVAEPGAEDGGWEYKFGALQYATEAGSKHVYFVELPAGEKPDVKIMKFNDLAAAGWELVGPVNLFDVNVFDSEKLLAATALRRAR